MREVERVVSKARPSLVRPSLKAVIRNVDHRARHDGLALTIKKHTGINIDTLEPGQFVLLMNTERTILSLYGPNRVLVQQKLRHPVSTEAALRELPRIFLQDKTLDYDQALRDFLWDTFPKWRPAQPKVIVRKRREVEAAA